MSATKVIPDELPTILRSFWFWIAAIASVRIIGLVFADGGIGPDEAQYWTWAQDPAFGYFSKPPVIAWIIAVTTGLFGDGEWAVRLAAPLLHAGSATFIYLAADRLFTRCTAMFAGLGWLTLPGVSVSSFLITTDAPLILFWSGALFTLTRLVTTEKPAASDYIWLGVFLGLGLLSKYAMLYFPAAAAVTCIFSPTARKALIRPQIMLTALIAGILFAPNVAWNAAHEFQTVAHTAANAHWSASLFKPASLIAFLGAQFVVFGPILFAALIAAVYGIIRKRGAAENKLILLVFALTPLVIVATQAFISRAHANWAAAAYPAAIILVSAFLVEGGRAIWAKASLAIHGGHAALFLIAMTNFALLDRIGAGRAVAELRGWEALSTQIASQSRGFDAILFDDRSMIATMLYYQRERNLEIASLDPNNGVHHHYEAFFAFRPDDHKRSLFASILPTDAHVNYRFGDIRPMGSVMAPIGDNELRTFTLFAISDYYGPPGIQYTD